MCASVVTGTLPSSWSNPEAFPSLINLTLLDMPLSGSLPASWADNGSFPSLGSLVLGGNVADVSRLSGTLPPEWGSAHAFQHISLLGITACNITGMYRPPDAYLQT